MLRKLYDQVLRLAASRFAAWWLAVVAFAESSVFPVPPDIMLAPMVFARPRRWALYALVCSVGSVLGGMLGYLIGYSLEGVGIAILSFFGHPEGIETYRDFWAHNGFWMILAKGVTPIPFKLVTIGAGLGQFNFLEFVAACVITRAGRFFIVAALVRKFGPQIQPVIEKRLALFTVLLVVIVVGGFLALEFLR